jgi:disulfide bond formation protein DsbB
MPATETPTSPADTRSQIQRQRPAPGGVSGGGGLGQTPSPGPDPYRWPAVGAVLTLALSMVSVLVLVGVVSMPRAEVEEPLVLAPSAVVEEFGSVEALVSSERFQEGHAVFGTVCIACHTERAGGKIGLGKDIGGSRFVAGLTDEELMAFVRRGRDVDDPLNTTGVAMPPSGARPDMTDEQLSQIVAYIRGVQGIRRGEAEWPELRPVPRPVIEVAEGTDPLVAEGHEAFVTACSSCHGVNAEGLPDLGKNLATSEFVDEKTAEELIAFVKQGRPMWDAANTTGIDMPPKGGNPALSDEELALIVGYLKSLHGGTK